MEQSPRQEVHRHGPRHFSNLGYANDIIKTPMKFGTEFETPSLKTMRKDRAAQGIPHV